jgi:hypothetical protein
MFVALTGEPPFDLENLSQNVTSGKIDWGSPIWRAVSEQGTAFVRELMNPSDVGRPTAREAIGHSWFKAMYPQGNKAPAAAPEVAPLVVEEVGEDDDGFGW